MNCTGSAAVDADFACSFPVQTTTNLQLINRCGTCNSVKRLDLLGIYNDRFICDDCGNKLVPARYNADMADILLTADHKCVEGEGSSISAAITASSVVLVEDDLGDVVYSGPQWGSLLTQIPEIGNATTDYLPEEIRLSHRKMHRECVKTLLDRKCLQTVQGRHWNCHIRPFVVEEEAFTLTVFTPA